ncbi:meteorin-like protein isoform X2 [Falco biarmicus]|uniref:meteorin-like protein isoform X2 n=1 Tax=Falco cherrug TaxID=345164 RepID=UPI00247962AA|nr:meteorin-like protein isoform X2 [Falco cherrug]XP_056188579.1 meteorin-like protein isoform X2 [Falco biarmicus]
MAAARGPRCLLALLRLLLLAGADRCSWRGSGLSWEPRSRAVEQVHLRCTEGSLEWMYPARALRVLLEPNLASARHTTVCIKPASDFQGASIYVEHAGQLHLVVSEAGGARPHHVSCFSAHAPQRVALFLQASPQRDISRRTASFQYELLSNQSTTGSDFKKMALVEAMCRPCDNVELLMAICSSDFVMGRTYVTHSRDGNSTEDTHTPVQKTLLLNPVNKALLPGLTWGKAPSSFRGSQPHCIFSALTWCPPVQTKVCRCKG